MFFSIQDYLGSSLNFTVAVERLRVVISGLILLVLNLITLFLGERGCRKTSANYCATISTSCNFRFFGMHQSDPGQISFLVMKVVKIFRSVQFSLDWYIIHNKLLMKTTLIIISGRRIVSREDDVLSFNPKNGLKCRLAEYSAA